MGPCFGTSAAVYYVDFDDAMISIYAGYVREGEAFAVKFTADSFDATGAATCRSFGAFYAWTRYAACDLFRYAARTSAAFRLTHGIFDGWYYVRIYLFGFYGIGIRLFVDRADRYFFSVFSADAAAASGRA